MLGAPISFSNLGTPITELFQVGEYQILSVAYRQILKYLQTYAAEAKSAFSMEDFSPSKADLESAETIRSFLESVRQKCRHLWAEFDIFTMSVGACLVRVQNLITSRESFKSKVRCIFTMVVVYILAYVEFGQNYHREDEPHFLNWGAW